jgi:hypothetical protein
VTDLSPLGAATRAVWTRADALALVSRGRIAAAVRDGEWQIVWEGVYADGGIVLDAEQRAFAAVLASGGRGQELAHWRAVASGRTAARVHGLPLIDDDDPATTAKDRLIDDVISQRPGELSRKTGEETYVLLRRQRALAPGDVVRLTSGLLVTSIARTLFDCASVLSHEAVVCVIDNALHRELVTADELAVFASARTGQAGCEAFRRALALADGRAESPAETLTRLLLLPHLPRLEPQVRLHDRYGRQVARFDLGDRVARFAVESDGKRGHSGEQMVAKDQARDRQTRGRGWRTERVRWFELRCRQPQLIARIVASHQEWMSRAA